MEHATRGRVLSYLIGGVLWASAIGWLYDVRDKDVWSLLFHAMYLIAGLLSFLGVAVVMVVKRHSSLMTPEVAGSIAEISVYESLLSTASTFCLILLLALHRHYWLAAWGILSLLAGAYSSIELRSICSKVNRGS